MSSRWPSGQPDSHAAGIAFLEVESSSQKTFFIPKRARCGSQDSAHWRKGRGEKVQEEAMMHAHCPQTSSGNHRGDMTLQRTRPGSSSWEGLLLLKSVVGEEPRELVPPCQMGSRQPVWAEPCPPAVRAKASMGPGVTF